MEKWPCQDCDLYFWVDVVIYSRSVDYCPYCGASTGAVVFVDEMFVDEV